jgi:hypothetical protein
MNVRMDVETDRHQDVFNSDADWYAVEEEERA